MAGPAKRVDEMSEEERLQSIKAWAEEQKYVRPGEGGTLGTGVRNFATQGIVYSGPVRYVHHGYEAPIAPPSYETATRQASVDSQEKQKKGGKLKQWLDKPMSKRDGPPDANGKRRRSGMLALLM